MDNNPPLQPLPKMENDITTDTISGQTRRYDQIEQLRRMTRENILKTKIRKMEIIRFGEDLPDITNVKKKAKKVNFFYKALTL